MNTNKQSVESSLHGLAGILAAIAALLASGQIWEYTASPVHAYLLETYQDHSIAFFGMWLWVILASLAVFHLARIVVVIALMIIAERLLVFVF